MTSHLTTLMASWRPWGSGCPLLCSDLLPPAPYCTHTTASSSMPAYRLPETVSPKETKPTQPDLLPFSSLLRCQLIRELFSHHPVRTKPHPTNPVTFHWHPCLPPSQLDFTPQHLLPSESNNTDLFCLLLPPLECKPQASHVLFCFPSVCPLPT